MAPSICAAAARARAARLPRAALAAAPGGDDTRLMNPSEVRPLHLLRTCAQRLAWLLPSLLVAACPSAPRGAPDPPTRPAPLPSGVLFDPVSVRCAPSPLPEPFVAEHRPDLAKRGTTFEQTRGLVVSTLGVLLAGGGWVGGGVDLGPSHGGARDGTGEECQWLYAVSRGVARGAPPPGSLALAGVIDVDYVPTHAGNPPQLVVRLVTALLHGGQALRLNKVSAATSYTEPGGAFLERNPEELTAELIRQVAEQLAPADPGPERAAL